MSRFPHGETYSFLVSLGQNEQVLPMTTDVYRAWDLAIDWVPIFRRQIADAFGLSPSCQFTISYHNRSGHEANLWVLLS
jgi:hypothetical protein